MCLHPCLQGTTALRSVLFKVGTDKVQVTLSGGRMTGGRCSEEGWLPAASSEPAA